MGEHDEVSTIADHRIRWVPVTHKDRVRGGALAMSRFLIFVWMEAEAQQMARVPGRWLDEERARVLCDALRVDSLTLCYED